MEEKSIFDKFLDSLPAITQSVIGVQQANACTKINAQRLKAGLPPVDCSKGLAPQINVGLSPDTQKLLIVGGIGLAVLAFMLMRKR